MAHAPEEIRRYRDTIVRELLALEPRLAPMRVVREVPRRSLLSQMRSGGRAFGCLGYPIFTAYWLSRRVNPSRYDPEPTFAAPAPKQPRALEIMHAPWQKDKELELSLIVEAWDMRCTLRWGHAMLGTSRSFTPRDLATIVSGILDDEIVLVRSSVCQEAGMGGPWYHTAYDELIFRDSGQFVTRDAEKLRYCCEAAAYIWSGNGDMQVVERRCDQAKEPWHSHTTPPEVRLPGPKRR